MLDFFYTILIAPLEYWMHAVLCWGYDRLHVWGWAIVVMSLVVTADLYQGRILARRRARYPQTLRS